VREQDSLWYMDAIFYEVYVRGFHDSVTDGNGDLRGLTDKLDYLRELGVDCLWLIPSSSPRSRTTAMTSPTFTRRISSSAPWRTSTA
jgi:pullulanase/glycogen debranching enzyme